jgi:hypothetical protein
VCRALDGTGAEENHMPESRREIMNKVGIILLGLSGIIPFGGLFSSPPDLMLLVYTLFVVLVLFRRRIRRAVERIPLPPSLQFIIFSIVSGWIGEVCAWSGAYAERSAHPALLHPQLIPDLVLAIGFYAGWAAGWLILFLFCRVSVAGVFITTGIFGVFVEQDGAIAKMVWNQFSAHPLLAAWLALYVFAVYGSLICNGYLPVRDLLHRRHPRLAWLKKPGVELACRYLKYPVAVALMWLGILLVFSAVSWLAGHLGLIPPPRPIYEHPFF